MPRQSQKRRQAAALQSVLRRGANPAGRRGFAAGSAPAATTLEVAHRSYVFTGVAFAVFAGTFLQGNSVIGTAEQAEMSRASFM